MLRKAAIGLAQVAATLALLFAPAGTLRFWQAWVYLVVVACASALIVVYLRRKDPQLLERRSRGPQAEKELSQKLIHFVIILSYAGAVVLSSFDHRFMWSHVPLFVEIAGYAIVAFGCFIYFIVFRENTFGAATIEVVPEQHVISSGPYAIVRHPMYIGLLTVFIGTPLALGSWWALLTLIPALPTLALRIRYEERFLTQNLPGYPTYCQKVPHRLIPKIW